METIEKEDFWGRVVAAPGEFESLVTEDAAWNACAEVVWRVVGVSLVLNGPPMLVSAWEENLGLVPAEGDGLNARKAAILQRLCDMGLPVTAGLLEAELTRRIGEGMAGVSLSGGTLTVSLALTATAEQIAAVEQLLGRVLPQNIVTEINEMPLGFSRVEYLEGIGNQYIVTNCEVTPETGVKIEYLETFGSFRLHEAIGTRESGRYWFVPRPSPDNKDNKQEFYYYTASTAWLTNWGRVIAELNFKNSGNLYLENLIGNTYQRTLPEKKDVVLPPLKLFGSADLKFFGVIWECEVSEGQEIVSKFVPALDQTGAPCFYDTVTKTPFYNSGAGDFLYPGKEAEATTYSLRRPLTYAQMTAHGIRRLYHVPRGYNGTREEYAAEHGYKVLVETPAPEEGYWSPVWHETEEEIVLEWVETEPPEEEGLIF